MLLVNMYVHFSVLVFTTVDHFKEFALLAGMCCLWKFSCHSGERESGCGGKVVRNLLPFKNSFLGLPISPPEEEEPRVGKGLRVAKR